MITASSIDINSKFQESLRIIESTTENLFLTGKAGTGKSTLLAYFRGKIQKSMVVLAPTGVSALNVGGQTIHFFGFKPNVSEKDSKKIAKTTVKKELYFKMDILVIDEVSMVRVDLLDCIYVFLQTVLKSKKSFT